MIVFKSYIGYALFTVLFACNNRTTEPVKDPVEFTGGNKFIHFNTSGIPNSTFTYEFWFKTDQIHEIDKEDPLTGTNGAQGQHFAVFPGYGGDGNARGTGVSVGINGVSLYEHKANYLNARIVYEGILKGWNHIAVVYDNNAPALYVNEVKVASKKATMDTIKPIFSLGTHSHNNKYFKALIDEFRVWSRALTEDEIRSNLKFTYTGLETGLEIYYNFDTYKTDKLIFDNSGNKRHGEINRQFNFRKYLHTKNNLASQSSEYEFSDVVDIIINDTINNIEYHIDKLEESSVGVNIIGWAFIKDTNAVKNEIYLVLRYKNKRYIFNTKPIKRTDVTKAFKLYDLDNSGFSAFIPFYKIQPGSYQIEIFINKNDSLYALVSTDSYVHLPFITETNNIKYSLEDFEEFEGGYNVRGWAFIVGKNSENSIIKLCIKSSTALYYFETNLEKRPDVTKSANGLFNLDGSGFQTFINKEDIEPGKNEVGIYIIKDDTIEALQFTKRFITTHEL